MSTQISRIAQLSVLKVVMAAFGVLTLLLSSSLSCQAQAQVDVHGRVLDFANGESLPFAAVVLRRGGVVVSGVAADADGNFVLSSLAGDSVCATYIGYEPITLCVAPKVEIRLTKTSVSLSEVRVTASESGNSATSTSVIGQTAMEHLQPASLTDLMALLPGGQTQSPQLGKTNSISLREVAVDDQDYAISSLGTKVNIDGAPIGTDADLQKITDAGQTSADANRQHVNRGVDMRAIPTDEIESVEVIRGIPSVRYGDLTSGVVNIHRKKGGSPLTVRFKVDPYSRIVSASKGLSFPCGWGLNIGAGLLKSNIDPRNNYETYTRVNVSLRGNKSWINSGLSISWQPTLDYNQNIDAAKQDPEIQLSKEDKYEARHCGFTLSNALTIRRGVLSVSLRHSAALSHDVTEQTKRVVNTQNYYAPSEVSDGLPHDVTPLEANYIANHKVDGLPFYSNLAANVRAEFTTGIIAHRPSVGIEWQCNKNYGDGQVFDTHRPLSATTMRRPRSFRSVPATNVLGYFAEDELSSSFGQFDARLTLGVRLSQMAGLPQDYAMSGKIYADPRANFSLDLPSLRGARFNVTFGIGRLCKMPTMDQLHPDKMYVDIYELNYWHAKSEYRRAIVRSYAVNLDAPDLQPAHNLKMEGRLCVKAYRHSLSVSLFREKMNDGFRYMKSPMTFAYVKYDVSGLSGSNAQYPDTVALPRSSANRLRVFTSAQNGSRIVKQGVEWQYESPRLPLISTRLSVSGAWLRTTRENSEPEWYQGSNKTVMGVVVDDVYAGLYDWHQTSVRSRTSTSFTVESYFDRIGFIFSATAECLWHSRTTTPLRNARPIAYMAQDGVRRDYTDAEAADPVLRSLILSSTDASFTSTERPYATFNFKATKRFGSYVSLSFFADRLLAASRAYSKRGYAIRRSFSPYFGAQAYVRFL